jgi:hypothetical protein
MNEDAEHAEPASPEDEVLARHKRVAEVLSGQRRMGWSDWKDMSIYESTCLTPDGQPVALWAVDVIQLALGNDFLWRVEDWLTRMRATGDTSLAPDAHPILSLGLWPANDVPWVYANLIWLAARINLFNRDRPQNRVGRVLKGLRQNLDPINWASALLQFEVAGLGLRAGWDMLFEPALGNGRSADVSLTNGPARLLVETTSMRRSVAERRAHAFFDRLSWQLHLLEWQYDVRIAGSLRSASPEQAEGLAQWLRDLGEAAGATGQDGRSRQVPGPGEVSVTVFRPTEATVGEPWGVEGDPVEAPLLERLIALLHDKNRQAEGSALPVWVRLGESAGLWEMFRSQGMTLTSALEFLTDFLQPVFVFFPNLAGVMLSPGVSWAGYAPPNALVERVERSEGIALRCPIPGHRYREMIIVPRAVAPGTDAQTFADWYAQEDTWLDWALAQMGYPPFNDLVSEPAGASNP